MKAKILLSRAFQKENTKAVLPVELCTVMKFHALFFVSINSLDKFFFSFSHFRNCVFKTKQKEKEK